MDIIGSERGRPARSFSNYFTVTLALGLLAGGCGVWPGGPGGFIIAPIVLLIPGVVRRNVSLAGVGLLIGFIVAPFCASLISSYAMVDRRDLVPLTLYSTPGMVLMNPAWSGIPIGWQGKAFLVLFSYLLPVDLGMVALHGLRPVRLRRGACAILASDLAVLLLYPLSWGAKTVWHYDPGPASNIPLEVFSLAVFALVFPAKYLVLNYVYDPKAFWAGHERDWRQ
jgi:hypothetical protein